MYATMSRTGTWTTNRPLRATEEERVNANQIALQLYTVRSRATGDIIGTLRELAEIGYTAVEFAGYGGVPVGELRSVLDELGMRAIAAHVPLDQFATRFDGVVDDLKTLGADHAIVPWIAPERRAELFGDTATLAATFDEWGGKCREAGLRFGYHNHDFEFAPAPSGEGTLLDALMGATDPALVSLELDAYWAAVPGFDPVAIIRRYAGRIPLLHVKDMAGGTEKADAPVGEGVLPWREILPAAHAAGTEWYIVEQDNPRDPMVDVGTSLRNLKAILGGA
jgi:sugar phosphate isomerase/epimerase